MAARKSNNIAIFSQSINGAGDTRTPTLINLACFWILQIPLAYWLAETMAWGPDGVFLAIVAAETLLTALGILAFRRGRWKSRHA